MKTGTEILVGTSGYSYPDWKGIVYPRELKKQVHSPVPELTFISRYFDYCEINATFYRHFEPKIAARWIEAVAKTSPSFQFGIKANQAFTHAAGSSPGARKAPTSVNSLKYTQIDVDQTKAFLEPLASADRLAVLLFQFPISFKFKAKNKSGIEMREEGSWDHVIDLLNAFRSYPKAVEFRHESWDDPWILSALQESDTAWVNIDEPKLGKGLHGTEYVTSSIAYMRLHGRNYKQWFQSKERDARYDYLYSEQELKPIAKAVEGMADKLDKVNDKRARKKAITATNNHFRGQAVANGLQLKSMLGLKDVEAPDKLVKTYPGLERFVVPGTAHMKEQRKD